MSPDKRTTLGGGGNFFVGGYFEGQVLVKGVASTTTFAGTTLVPTAAGSASDSPAIFADNARLLNVIGVTTTAHTLVKARGDSRIGNASHNRAALVE